MSNSIYIDDGYTLSKSIPGTPAYPTTVVVYRPVLNRGRRIYMEKSRTLKPEQMDEFECDLIAKHVVTIDGQAVTKERAAKLHPNVFEAVVSLVTGYTEADEDASGKNSSTA